MGDSRQNTNPLRSKRFQLLKKHTRPDVNSLINEITNKKNAIFEKNEESVRAEQTEEVQKVDLSVNQPTKVLSPEPNKKKVTAPTLRLTKKAPARVSMGKSRMSFDEDNMSSLEKQRIKKTIPSVVNNVASTNVKRLNSITSNSLKKRLSNIASNNVIRKQPKNPTNSINVNRKRLGNEEQPSADMNQVIDFTFYNEALKTLTVLSDETFVPSEVAKPYIISQSDMNRSLVIMSKSFKNDLKFAKKKQLKYWFILEQPFRGCVDSTFTKGHSFISRLPINFRISNLPTLLKRCELTNSGITHVVLNITSNWITEFDVSDTNAKEVYESLLGELVTIFKECGVKKIVILTFPFEKVYEYSAGNLHLLVQQTMIDINKKIGNILEYLDYHFLLKSNKLEHGNEGFRFVLKHINDNYFKT